MGAAIIAAATSIATGILVYYLTYRSTRRLDLRKDRLSRVDRQLADLYGPLVAYATASDTTWRKFADEYNVRELYFGDTRPTEEHLKRWETWMRQVFMPLNRRMYEAVVSHADLLIDDEIPPCLLDLFAHVSGYEATLKQWEDGDYTEYTSLSSYPYQAILSYTQASYNRLKKEQASLLSDIDPPS